MLTKCGPGESGPSHGVVWASIQLQALFEPRTSKPEFSGFLILFARCIRVFCALLQETAHACRPRKGGGAAIRNTLGRRQHDVCKTVMESAPSTTRSRSATGLPATQVPCDTEAIEMDPLGACSGISTASCACDLGSAPGMRIGRCKIREAR